MYILYVYIICIYYMYISQFSMMESQHVFIFPVPDLSMFLFAFIVSTFLNFKVQ